RPLIGRLPGSTRRAIERVELEGMSQRAAAEAEGLSLSGMKSRVQRGRERLREMLLDCCAIALDRRGGIASCESPGPGTCGERSREEDEGRGSPRGARRRSC
ncbi:MAG TPA: sigma factor-like helix-turn-helix DNA-binding protein, partial [Vicinamibacteria bacterium]|nr:sigma factor-like helix-turn-helix DNA-binding protein [Vicinamibacteria bacterium]